MLDRILHMYDNTIAYKYHDEELSYQELYTRAKYYGELLKRQGISPVIILGHKDIDTFVSIFACIYAGRAYVPLDLWTPIDRINKIIDSTKCTLILTTEEVLFPNISVRKLHELEIYNDNPIYSIHNDTAYIIFTSGSTGEPKGVPISYDNLLHFIQWISLLEPLKDYKNIVVLNQASFSFDLSVADIFYAVSNGHTLVALDKESQENYSDIFDIISKNNINLLVVTPTFLKLCLTNREFTQATYPSIMCIYCCGEQLEVNTVKKVYDAFSNVRIINAYGPTEATSAVSAVCISKDMLECDILPCGDISTSAVNIQIENEEIILKGKSVFDGYLGEHIGGYYVENDINCFYTGDIGYIQEGLLYCKGRKDSQIKYKGYRIEISDIESNLYKIHGVRECAVVAKYQGEYSVKLIKAFVVIEDFCTVENIKEELKKYIPSYMMPKSFVVLDRLPVNQNGKIDRKRLLEL